MSGFSTIIRTLDPAKLTFEDYIQCVRSKKPGTIIAVYHAYDGRPRVSLLHSPAQQDPGHLRDNLGGFLYYHQPPHTPPLAGQLRFRFTPSSDPISFPSGHDLLSPNGIPWSIPLPAIARNTTFAPIQTLLTTLDATVPQSVMDLARANGHVFKASDAGSARYLHSFGQPFDLPLDTIAVAFAVAGRDRIAHAVLHNMATFEESLPPWHEGRRSTRRHFPFSGTALCCFEPSALPEHSGKRVVVIRVLRSLEWDPVRLNPSYDGPPIPPKLYPQAGQLLMKLRYRKPQTWARDVDKYSPKRENTARPFATLFDNAVEYGSPYRL